MATEKIFQTVITQLTNRGIYSTQQTVSFSANPGAVLEGYLKSGSGTYIFQNGTEDPITMPVVAPQQFRFDLQGGNYTLTMLPNEPSEFNAILRNIILV